MEDMAARIQEILSDKESMKQLNELAQMFSSDSNEGDGSGQTSEEKRESGSENENGMPDFDFSKLMLLQNIMGNAGSDKTSQFLVALKPLLKEERQERVDRAVKMLKLFAVWEILKESGIMNDFFQ